MAEKDTSTTSVTPKTAHVRGKFSGQFAFVLAAAASAVGLGNLWRFPYLAAQYGGGAFLLTYLILIATFGFTLLLVEVAIGRKTGMSSIKAFQALGKRYAFIGVIQSIAPILIISFYCTVGGWIMKYLFEALSGNMPSVTADTYFPTYISSTEPIAWGLVFMFLTLFVVYFGVKSGIERLNKILMPALITISILLSIYVLAQPGAMAGLAYYLIPDVSKFSVGTVVAAMGQMFFSMSLASGVMMTYGSYMSKQDNMETSVGQIEFFDTIVAFLAGLIIVPSVFVFAGGEASAINAGPGLLFVTLPKMFVTLPFGNIIAALFFLLVFFAAITSSVSIAEAVTAIIGDQFNIPRKRAFVITAIGLLILSLPPALGFNVWSFVQFNNMGIMDMMDFVASSVLMPLGALLMCVVVGWKIGPQFVVEEVEISENFKRKKVFVFVLKYIAPIFLTVILVTSILSALGIIKF